MSNMEQVSLTQDEIALLEIAADPQWRAKTGRNGIRWGNVVAARPELRSVISYGKSNDKGKRTLKALAKRGITPETFAGLEGQPQASGGTPKKDKPKTGLTENEKLVMRVAREYQKENGNVDWKAAMVGIPELDKVLNLGGGKKMFNAYMLLNAMKKQGLINKQSPNSSSNGKGNGEHDSQPQPRSQAQLEATENARRAHMVSVQVERQVQVIINECRCCPRCGKNLEQIIRLGLMEAKLQS